MEPTKEMIDKFWNRADRSSPDTCWNWQGGKTSGGYGVLSIGGKQFYAHRLAFEFSHRELNLGEHVIHTCDNPACCNPRHLRAGSHADNMADMATKGRAKGGSPGGSRQGTSKLTEAQVIAIRKRYDSKKYDGKKLIEIAQEYGVTPQCIYYAVKKGWKHVPQRNTL